MEPGHAEAAPAAPPAPAPSRRGRILVIDDEEAVGRAVARILGRDHEVEVFADGRAGLARLLAERSFDLVLCDLMMPELTGMELHAEVKELAPALLPAWSSSPGAPSPPRPSTSSPRWPGRLWPSPSA